MQINPYKTVKYRLRGIEDENERHSIVTEHLKNLENSRNRQMRKVEEYKEREI
jgi:hypothetical protein